MKTPTSYLFIFWIWANAFCFSTVLAQDFDHQPKPNPTLDLHQLNFNKNVQRPTHVKKSKVIGADLEITQASMRRVGTMQGFVVYKVDFSIRNNGFNDVAAGIEAGLYTLEKHVYINGHTGLPIRCSDYQWTPFFQRLRNNNPLTNPNTDYFTTRLIPKSATRHYSAYIMLKLGESFIVEVRIDTCDTRNNGQRPNHSCGLKEIDEENNIFRLYGLDDLLLAR